MRVTILAAAIAVALAGCARNLAVLYVATEPEGAEVISIYDGQHLDDGAGTPTEVVFQRNNFPYPSDAVKLMIYKDCYRPEIRTVIVDRWYEDLEQARINGNNARPRLARIANCELYGISKSEKSGYSLVS